MRGAADAVNPERTGTKVAADHVLEIAPGDSASVRLRLTASDGSAETTKQEPSRSALGFDRVLSARRAEADQFYATLIPPRCPRTRRW